MRTFENDDAFVEVFAEGARIHQRWGRTNHSSFNRTDSFASVELASRVLEARVRSLSRRYTPGFVQEQLLIAMRKTPKNPAPFLVYSDWLQQFGDPLGVLISRTTIRREAESLVGENAPHFFPRCMTDAKYFWELGFIVRAEVTSRDTSPIHELFVHPSSAFIRELAITTDHQNGGLEPWKKLFTQGVPTTLERIEVRKKGVLAPLAFTVPIVVAV